MKRTNKKGGAAIVAVLIVIMLVAVGSAALVVTGRYTIQASKVADAVVKVNSKPEESSSEEVSEVDDLSSVVEDSMAGGNDENDLLSAGGDAFGNRSGFSY